MALTILSDCIACDLCRPECPNRAISFNGAQYAIDPALCTECEGFYSKPQCQTVCPLRCIRAAPSSPFNPL